LRKCAICQILLDFRALLSGHLNTLKFANLFLREP
jgi:hypothetical protein